MSIHSRGTGYATLTLLSQVLLASACAPAGDADTDDLNPPVRINSDGDVLNDGPAHDSETPRKATELGAAASKQDKGFYLSTALWPRYDIPVCWETAGFATKKALVRSTVADWEVNSSLLFTGWGNCGDTSDGIRIRISDERPHVDMLGKALAGRGAGMVLNFTFNDWGTSCAADKDRCIAANGMHEFGHAVGLAHEHNRESSWRSCLDDPQGTNGDIELGGFDPDSIMNYCYDAGDIAHLSIGDVAAVQEMYGLNPKDDVAVIPDSDTPCPGETLTFHLDNEDDDVNNQRSGWNGAWESTNNTLLVFCRVSGLNFSPLGTQTSRRSDYAVLKLGAQCPAGSSEFTRYFDDEDTDNESSSQGRITPNVSGGNTKLTFCVFTGGSGTMASLPNLGFPYGVLASPEFAFGRTPGWVRTDDEDDDNNNSSSGTSAGTSMVEVGSNTKMFLWSAP